MKETIETWAVEEHVRTKMTLQRYSYDLVPVGYDGARIEICADDDGEWVKASDAEAALEKERALTVYAIERRDALLAEKDARIKELETTLKSVRTNMLHLINDKMNAESALKRIRGMLPSSNLSHIYSVIDNVFSERKLNDELEARDE